jgi:aryl-alcohol dehydrogenase-like predicted oxidoreductase
MMKMRHGTIPGIPIPLSRLVQGTVMIRSEDAAGSTALLDAAFALGCNTFDTAHVYGEGDSERLFGRWLRERDLRDRIVVIAKGAHSSAERTRLTPQDIDADLRESLARMQLEVIDLYLLHQDDPGAPVAPIMAALDDHRRAGRIRAFGVSNWDHRRIAEANALAAERELAPIVASSPALSLAAQLRPPWPGCLGIGGPGAEARAARAWYREQQMPLFAWSSLAAGFFSGRYRPEDPHTAVRHHLDRLCIDTYACDDNFRRLDRARTLATEKGVTVAQVALAWLMSQPLDVFAVVGATTPAHLAECARAVDLSLSVEECSWLELERDEHP